MLHSFRRSLAGIVFVLSYCITDLPDHELVECEEYLVGGIDAISLSNADVVIADYEDPADWTVSIDAGTTKIIGGIRAEFPQATITETEAPVGGSTGTIITGMDFQLNVLDYNSTDGNDDFWAEANGKKMRLAWREPENSLIKVIEVLITVVATPVEVPGDNKQLQKYTIALKGTGKKDFRPYRYDEPAGIFDV